MPRVTCPVCTLHLREDMSLSKHLHTHPKALVIEALARMAGTDANEGTQSSSLVAVRTIELSPYPRLEPAPPPPPPPQLTSILYHQQLISSTTTSFVDPSCLPPPPQLMMAPAATRLPPPTRLPPAPGSVCNPLPPPPVISFMNTNRQISTTTQTTNTQQLDLFNVGYEEEEEEEEDDQEEEEEEEEVVHQVDDDLEEDNQCPIVTQHDTTPTTTATFQYPQLDNLNFQSHTLEVDKMVLRENNVDKNDDVLVGEAGVEEEEEEEVMNIGTVITDSQKIISNNSPLYLEQTSPPYVKQSSAAPGCSKSPIYVTRKAPGSPVYVQTNVPGSTVFVQNTEPVSPVYTPNKQPLSPNRFAPGSPVYATDKAPGSPSIYGGEMAPGSPIYAEDKAPGSPSIYQEGMAPGSTIFAEDKAPGSPSMYREGIAPGSTIFAEDKAPGSPSIYREGMAPGSPIYAEDKAPGSPRIYQEGMAPVSPVLQHGSKSESAAEVLQQAHSPASSCYSVRVRRDLGTPGRSPSRDEYIVPGFEFEGDDDDDDNSEIVDDAGLSLPPLNIHTDESMPPRGELSGHGTNSSSMWQTREMDVQQQPTGSKKQQQQTASSSTNTSTTASESQSWRREPEPADLHILPDSSEEGISVIRESQQSHSLIQFGEQIRDATGEPFSSVCFIQPKKEKVKVEAASTIKLDDIKQDAEVRKEVKRRIRTCITCDQVFPTAEEFNLHIRRVHPFECKACGRCFMRASGLTLHQKRHLKIKPYRCSYCEKSFVTNQKLTEHHNTHTGNSPYKCNQCEASFKRYSNLIQHKNRSHLKIKRKAKDYFCDCGEVFHSPLKLAWHKESHDSNPKKCTYCSSRFIHEASLTRHIRKAHDPHYIPVIKKFKVLQTTRENVECPICHKVCLKGSLRNHMVMHSGVKPYACSSCGKRFFSKWNMKLHMWVHGPRSSMPFKCDVKSCKASFVRESDLQDHLRSHKNQRQYSCNYCGRQFLRRFSCLRHTREHEQVKKHECKVCGKKFHRSYYLTEHMRTHTGLKPFTCHICSKQTATKTNHNKHMKTHHARQIIASEN